MRNLHPAEELAQIRTEIRHLKAREAELRAGFLSGDSPPCEGGPTHRVCVHESRARVFDQTRLPAAILQNPRFYRDQVSARVVLELATDEPALPGFAPVWEDTGDLVEPCH